MVDAVGSDPAATLVALLRDRLLAHQDTLGEAKLTVLAAEPTREHAEALREHFLKADIWNDEEVLGLIRQLPEQSQPAAVGPGAVAATLLIVFGSASIGGVQPPSQVVWEVAPRGKGEFELCNTGSATAYDVQLNGHAVEWFKFPRSPSTWEPGDWWEFQAAGTLPERIPTLKRIPTLLISWRENSDSQRSECSIRLPVAPESYIEQIMMYLGAKLWRQIDGKPRLTLFLPSVVIVVSFLLLLTWSSPEVMMALPFTSMAAFWIGFFLDARSTSQQISRPPVSSPS